MKVLFLAILIVGLLAPAGASARTCPTRANNLEDFKGCMVPMRGTIGTAAVYSSGNYDEAHRELMSAMARSNVVPPQVMPTYGMSYPGYAIYNPYFMIASSYMNVLYRFNAPYAVNPYYFGYRR